MSEGWIKIWRKAQDNEHLQEADVFGVFCRLVMMASLRDRESYVGKTGKVIKLQRGQLWVSTRDLAAMVSSHKRIRTILKKLEMGTLIGTGVVDGITVVTICNYDRYQGDGDEREAHGARDGAHERHSRGTQIDRRKVKKDKNLDSSLRSESSSADADPPPRDLAADAFDVWAEELGETLPRPKALTPPRRKRLRTVLMVHFGNDLARWRKHCQRIRGSPFLTGSNERGWRADFDFCLTDKAVQKVSEGAYDISPNGGQNRGFTGRKPPSLSRAIRSLLHQEGADFQDVSQDGEPDFPALARRR